MYHEVTGAVEERGGGGGGGGGGGYLLSYIQGTMGVPLGVRQYNINLGTLAIIEILYEIFNDIMI